jgi:hypothetical protein
VIGSIYLHQGLHPAVKDFAFVKASDFQSELKRYLPAPRVYHAYPLRRLGVIT